ncbi:unnamed protein product [Pipistrellus nathusii]|uniref:Uncharacterized protein n=1 Tax=Pipistrellus nathusii TaxID=59473 RepID=A0ABN9ZBI5_PIPNA
MSPELRGPSVRGLAAVQGLAREGSTALSSLVPWSWQSPGGRAGSSAYFQPFFCLGVGVLEQSVTGPTVATRHPSKGLWAGSCIRVPETSALQHAGGSSRWASMLVPHESHWGPSEALLLWPQ